MQLVALWSKLCIVVGALSVFPGIGEATQIPFNEKFPKAQHPFAQRPDGCSGIRSPREVRDTWGPVDFTPACNNHDRCYYTLGSDWKSCNERFRTGLLDACYQDLRVWIPGIERRTFDFRTGKFKWVTVTAGRFGPPEPNSYALCVQIAGAYYTAVQGGVAVNIFRDAQDLQKLYEDWVLTLRRKENTHGLTCIENTTDRQLNYRTKWGEGNWERQSIEPGQWKSHFWRYESPNLNRSPKLLVAFDYDMSDRTLSKQYSMRKFAVPDVDCNQLGPRSFFRWVSGRSEIDLFFNSSQSSSYSLGQQADGQGDSPTEYSEPGEDRPAEEREGMGHAAIAIEGACAEENGRFVTRSGGCTDRASQPFVVFSKPSFAKYTHGQAVTYCDELVEGTFDDWSLPSEGVLSAIRGRPFETAMQLDGRSAFGQDFFGFWTLSAAGPDRALSVPLLCGDEVKDTSGRCPSPMPTLRSKEHGVICNRFETPAGT